MKRDLIQGNPTKLIISFFFPVLLGNLFQQFYNIVDTIVVGRFISVNALAAVGSTGSLNFMVMGFVLGMCNGFSIPIANYFGARDMQNVRKCIANIIYLSVGTVIVLTVGTMLGLRSILVLMDTPADIFDDAYIYLQIIFAGIGVMMFYNVLANISRALGDSRTPLYFLIISSILHVIMDIVFIVVFKLGVASIGVATVLSQAVSGILCFVYMKKKFPEIALNKSDMRPDRKMMAHLLFMGIPMALQFSITAFGSVILQSAINSFGSVAVATIVSASKVQLILTQPMEAMGATMATYCSQNLGARRLDRVKEGIKKSLMLTAIFAVAGTTIALLFGTQMGYMFIDKGQTEILEGMRVYFTCVTPFFIALGSLLVFRNAVQGLGYALPAMAAGIFEMIARSLVAFVAVNWFGFMAVCFANPAAWTAANILLIPVYLRVYSKLEESVLPPDTTEKTA